MKIDKVRLEMFKLIMEIRKDHTIVTKNNEWIMCSCEEFGTWDKTEAYQSNLYNSEYSFNTLYNQHVEKMVKETLDSCNKMLDHLDLSSFYKQE